MLLSSLSSIPTDVQSVVLTPTKVKLDSHSKAESYTLTTKATIAKAITCDITIRADSP